MRGCDLHTTPLHSSPEAAVLSRMTRRELPIPPERGRSVAEEGGAAPVGILASILVFLIVGAHAADELAIDVVNASEPTLCAETDNVYVKLASPDVRRFTVEAVHPAYMGTIVVDR
jgi:hypothetical protein